MARKSGSNGEKTAKLLRAAALKLFAAHGYAAVSMRQIAQEIGVQAGALYLYTPDKQTLLFELLNRHMVALLQAWEAAPKLATDDPVKRLECFVRFHIRFHLPRAEHVFISYMELRNLTEENFQSIEKSRRTYEAILRKILIDGQNSGAFNLADAKVSTFAIIAMLTGMNTWYRQDGRLSLKAVEEIYLNMVLSGVGVAKNV
ncbi:MAG: TetR/AcrR family transcriptional regulator [Paracoccaceae bacterium]